MKVSYKTFSISRKALLASFLLASSVFTTTAMAQTQDGRDFSIDGFAAYEGTPGTNWYRAGGTTGGASGKVVKANTFSELQAYLQAEDPYVVIVDHDISTGIKCYVDGIDTASAFWWHPIRPSLESLTLPQAKLLSSPTSPL